MRPTSASHHHGSPAARAGTGSDDRTTRHVADSTTTGAPTTATTTAQSRLRRASPATPAVSGSSSAARPSAPTTPGITPVYADATKRTTESATTSPATMTATAPTRLATPTGSFQRARGSRRASTTPQTTPVATCATRYRIVIATESVTPAITYIHSGPVPRTARPTAANGAKNSVSPRPRARSAASTRPGRPAPPGCGRTHARLAAKRNRRQVRSGAPTPAS